MNSARRSRTRSSTRRTRQRLILFSLFILLLILGIYLSVSLNSPKGTAQAASVSPTATESSSILSAQSMAESVGETAPSPNSEATESLRVGSGRHQELQPQPYSMTASASLYRTPSTDARVLSQLNSGDSVTLLGFIRDGMVALRTHDELMGYVESSAISQSIVSTLVTKEKPKFSPAKAVNMFDSSFDSLSMEEKLESLRRLLPDEKYWNYMGVDIDGLSQDWASSIVTDTPCVHSENGYEFCHEYDGATMNLFDYESNIQCLGFASLISDILFGKDAPVNELDDFSRLKLGDHIRYVDNEHSMIVTAISGDSVTVVQCNSDYENCMIEWDCVLTQSEIEENGDYMYISRY